MHITIYILDHIYTVCICIRYIYIRTIYTLYVHCIYTLYIVYTYPLYLYNTISCGTHCREEARRRATEDVKAKNQARDRGAGPRDADGAVEGTSDSVTDNSQFLKLV